MQQPRISLGEDLNREPGYTIFTIEGLSGVVDRISYSVVRHGYDLNYLGDKAWQAAFSWLEPEDAWYENGTLKFIVPPDVTWQLDPQGYVLRLNLTPNIGDVSFDFFWPEVLPAESTGQPANAQRLSGTRVKPVAADMAGQASAMEAIAPRPEKETPVVPARSDTQAAPMAKATPADGQESAPAEEEATTPSRRTAARLEPNTLDEPSKGPKPVLIILAMIAIFALLAGLCLFFLNSGSPDKKADRLSDRPANSEASGSTTDMGPDRASPSSAEAGPARMEIKEVAKPAALPETTAADEPNPDGKRQNNQTENMLQNVLQQEKVGETSRKADDPDSIEPALRRQVGE